MAAPSKTQGTSLFALANTAASAVSLGSALDVSTKISVTVSIHFGRVSSTPFTTAPTIRLEYSAKSSGNGFWWPYAEYVPQLGATLTAQAVNGTVSASATVVTLASTTNFAIGDLVYIKNTTIGNSEWGRVKAISSNVSITLQDGLNNAQTGSTVYRAAEMFSTQQMDVTSIGRIRLVVDNAANSAAGLDVEAWVGSFDSFA